TLLHVAVINSIAYVWIRLLLMRGADPCAQDKDGYTPAHYAVERDDVEMLKALTVRFHIKSKALPHNQINKIRRNCYRSLVIRENFGGMIAFMLACFKEATKCIVYIHQFKMDHVNTQDIFGDTSLMYAVARNNKQLTEYLISECKADVNGGSVTRPSALDIAILNNNLEIEQILQHNNCYSHSQIKRTKYPDDLCLYIERLSLEKRDTEKNFQPITKILEPSDIDNNWKQLLEPSRTTSENMVQEDHGNVINSCQKDLVEYSENCEVAGSHENKAKILNNIGLMHHRNGEYGKALEYYLQALGQALKTLPLINSDLANYHGNIGLIYAIQANNISAEKHFKKALEIRRMNLEANQGEIGRLEKLIEKIKDKQQ
ncbi:unnamed protein product, partial [Didymodactylos carnosus]